MPAPSPPPERPLRILSGTTRSRLPSWPIAVRCTIGSGNGVLALLGHPGELRQTLEIADRGYVLENGRIALAGTGRALLADAYMRAAYLGLSA